MHFNSFSHVVSWVLLISYHLQFIHQEDGIFGVPVWLLSLCSFLPALNDSWGLCCLPRVIAINYLNLGGLRSRKPLKFRGNSLWFLWQSRFPERVRKQQSVLNFSLLLTYSLYSFGILLLCIFLNIHYLNWWKICAYLCAKSKTLMHEPNV